MTSDRLRGTDTLQSGKPSCLAINLGSILTFAGAETQPATTKAMVTAVTNPRNAAEALRKRHLMDRI